MSLLEIARKVEAEINARKVGITAADVLRIFPGARIVRSPNQQTLRCVHCGGMMTERIERHRHVFSCKRCGRSKK